MASKTTLRAIAPLLSVKALELVGSWSTALAATDPGLGTASSFAVLGGSTVTNTGPSVITGDLGVWPGSSVTGFPPLTVNGAEHQTDAVALQAQSDLTTAYNSAAAQPVTQDLTGQDLGGKLLTPGVYRFSSSAQLTGPLTLDGQGAKNARFIFQIAARSRRQALRLSASSTGPRAATSAADRELCDIGDRNHLQGQPDGAHQHHAHHRRQHSRRSSAGPQRCPDARHQCHFCSGRLWSQLFRGGSDSRPFRWPTPTWDVSRPAAWTVNVAGRASGWAASCIAGRAAHQVPRGATRCLAIPGRPGGIDTPRCEHSEHRACLHGPIHRGRGPDLGWRCNVGGSQAAVAAGGLRSADLLNKLGQTSRTQIATRLPCALLTMFAGGSSVV